MFVVFACRGMISSVPVEAVKLGGDPNNLGEKGLHKPGGDQRDTIFKFGAALISVETGYNKGFCGVGWDMRVFPG